MNGFIKREEKSAVLREQLKKLFADEYQLIPFGVESIFEKGSDINKFLCDTQKINGIPAAMMLQFLPDYILFKKSSPQTMYFLEFKLSTTPCWAESRVKFIKRNDSSADYSNIGEIAREALLSYKRFYPDTILIMACNYNKKLLMCNYVKNIESIYSSDSSVSMKDCPINTGKGFFTFERNKNSVGSGTPNANINLDKFINIEKFFSELNIPINKNILEVMLKEIKNMEVTFENDRAQRQKQKIIEYLIKSGCNHLKEWKSGTIHYVGRNQNTNNQFAYIRDDSGVEYRITEAKYKEIENADKIIKVGARVEFIAEYKNVENVRI